MKAIGRIGIIGCALLLAGCLVSLSGPELKTDQAGYELGKAVHVLAKADGSK